MKIVHVTDFYHPFVGGVEQHVRTLAATLAGRGHDVAVATLWHDGLAEQEEDGPVRIWRLRSTTGRASWLFRHPQRPWAPPFPDPEVVRGLQRLLKREKPDIVHGHDWLARAYLPLKPLAGIPFVVSLHYYTQSCAKKNLVWQEQFCQGPSPARCPACAAAHYGAAKGLPVALTQAAFSALERRAVDIFLPVSEATARGNGLPDHGSPYTVVPNFLADEPAALAPEVAPFLRQLPDEPFLLFVGDFRRDKGLFVLLEAYRMLQAAPPLVLIGKRWDETPASFPGGVLELGQWPNAAVRAAWRRALFAVAPSVWPEPFGIVAIEAMAAGRPVVASAAGGLAEVVVDGESGLLVPPGDAAALAAAMRRLLAGSALRERLAAGAHRRAGFYQAATVVPRIEAVYRRLLAAPRGTPSLQESVEP